MKYIIFYLIFVLFCGGVSAKSEGEFSLNDLESRAKIDLSIANQWIDLQKKMNSAFHQVSEFDQRTQIKNSLKIKAWKRFLDYFAKDNPFTHKDNQQRNTARLILKKRQGINKVEPKITKKAPQNARPKPKMPKPIKAVLLLKNGSKCPTGYVVVKEFCKPTSSNRFAMGKIKSCPGSFHPKGNYCLSSKAYGVWKKSKCPTKYYPTGKYCIGKPDAEFIVMRKGACPKNYQRSAGYCVRKENGGYAMLRGKGRCPPPYKSERTYCVSPSSRSTYR